MMQQPTAGGKAGAPQGKAAGAPQGKTGGQAQPGAGGKAGGGQGQAPGAGPNMLSMAEGLIGGGGAMGSTASGGGGMYGAPAGGGTMGSSASNGSGTPNAQYTKDWPMFTASAQGFEGAGAAQQNPNEGGASTSPSALTSPSTEQGGMTA